MGEQGSADSVSIHAPLAGCDDDNAAHINVSASFNPRTPRGGRRADQPIPPLHDTFQSTHPSRGATSSTKRASSMRRGFNPRTPRGVRHHRRAHHHRWRKVSIHAPLAGCDAGLSGYGSRCERFNPRTPRGVRLPTILGLIYVDAFQSTHPSRGATAHKGCSVVRATFQSTHPSRGATIPACLAHRHLLVSIHAPLAGCDLSFEGVALRHCVSIHAPLAGCDRYPKIIELSIQLFQSTHPSRGATRCRGQPV